MFPISAKIRQRYDYVFKEYKNASYHNIESTRILWNIKLLTTPMNLMIDTPLSITVKNQFVEKIYSLILL